MPSVLTRLPDELKRRLVAYSYLTGKTINATVVEFIEQGVGSCDQQALESAVRMAGSQAADRDDETH